MDNNLNILDHAKHKLRLFPLVLYSIPRGIAYIVYWELSAEEKVCEFRKSGSIHECFLALFNLGWNFCISDCLNRKSFLANYGKKGNLRNFSFADDS